MATMGFSKALLPIVFLTAALACAQTGPVTDLPLGHPLPPDTTLTRQQADQGRDGMIAPLKISYGKKWQEWTAQKLSSLPHENLQIMDARNQAKTFSGVPLMALLVELGVPQKLKGKDLKLYALVEGRDGSKVVYSLGEISPDVHEGTVLLVDSVDGKPLEDTGPIQLISSGERRDSRWVRGVVSIRVQSAD
jgi:hypothetical protein